MTRFLCACLLLTAVTFAQRPGDRPLALVTDAGQSHLLRAGADLDLALRKGDLLFEGDRITVESGGATLWFCPSAQILQFGPASQLRVEPTRITVPIGRIVDTRSLPFCPIPEVTRESLSKPIYFGREISRGGLENAALTREAQSALDAELSRIDQSNVADPALRTAARAAVYAKYGLHQSSADAFDSLSNAWSSIDWPRQLVHQQHDLSTRGDTSTAAIGGSGKTYALLVGISDYPRLLPEQRLHFADSDAELMYSFLRSPRGGAIPREDIRLLLNKDATAAAIRNHIGDFLRARATSNDTVIFFIAAHGVAGAQGAHIIAYDSDPDNLADTGIDMLEIQDLLEGGIKEVGHVLIFIDVCHAGLIGNIHNRNFTRILQILGRFKGEETYGLLASAPDETSVESERFGGGHGAFSYFLSQALNGAADEDSDGRVTVNELQAYVYNMVRRSTRNRQNPRPTGDMPGARILISDLSKTGIEIKGWQPSEAVAQARQLPLGPVPQAPLLSGNPDIRRFEQALAEGRLLPPAGENALDLLRLLRPSNPLERILLENALRIALENQGQQVLLRYLRGEEIPQRQSDFEQGAAWFDAALSLDPDALAWQSRSWFCQARVMLFKNRFAEAQELLERAVRLEPGGPYLYNALGLLYLQQANFTKAAAAFRDSIRLAPYWSYPRHNLGLSLAQSGAYNEAIAAYRDAQSNAPNAWFIPYNLGLVQQQVGRLRDAESAFRHAAALSPSRPEPETALGYLAAVRAHSSEAERLYRSALVKEPDFVPARHNLALLLESTNRSGDAIALWQSIIQKDPSYIPSRLALASAFEHAGRPQEALGQYREAVSNDPQLNAARLSVARLLIGVGKPGEAETDLRSMLASQPKSAAAWDLLGDALAAQLHPTEASEAYTRALALSAANQRRTISRKVKQMRKP